MICKIFKRGKGSASGIDYLMSANDAGGNPRNPKAELIRGDIATTKKLIAATKYAQKYTSGVLSWSENPDSMRPEQINQVIESFQNMVCAGLSSERINWLWVKHQDKGRLELHFVIPNVDLITGRRFAPYYDRSDRPLYRAWERYTNALYGFTNPADPMLKRKTVIAPYLPENKQKALALINSRINILAKAGQIQSRKDVIHDLETIGLEISRAGKDYISIRDKSGKKLRLRGGYFEESFHIPAKMSSPGSLFDLDALLIELNTQLAKRARYIQGRFERPTQETKAVPEVVNEGIRGLSPEIVEEHRANSTEIQSGLATTTQSVAGTVELFMHYARKFIARVELFGVFFGRRNALIKR